MTLVEDFIDACRESVIENQVFFRVLIAQVMQG